MSTAGVLYRGRTPIEMDVLSLPEVLVDSYDVSAEKVLKPFFDFVWNACGFERSLNYDGSGNWRPKQQWSVFWIQNCLIWDVFKCISVSAECLGCRNSYILSVQLHDACVHK